MGSYHGLQSKTRSFQLESQQKPPVQLRSWLAELHCRVAAWAESTSNSSPDRHRAESLLVAALPAQQFLQSLQPLARTTWHPFASLWLVGSSGRARARSCTKGTGLLAVWSCTKWPSRLSRLASKNWVAAKELELSDSIGETLFIYYICPLW